MKYSILTSVVLCASFALASVARPGHALERSAEAVQMVDITYIGPITPGGKNHTLVGNAKEIYDQIMQLNPLYNIDDFNIPPHPKKDLQLAGRSPIRLGCDVTRNYANPFAIEDGIEYLISLGAGSCSIGPKPSCSRVSCSWDSAIYLCNDNSFRIGPSCNYLGYRMAQDIYDNCNQGNIIMGQIWDEQNYNVIVSGSNNFNDGGC